MARVPISKAIDPKRKGISKSLVVATSLCARKGWHQENIRLADGSRPQAVMPERVHFGSALDEATMTLIYRHWEQGQPITDDLITEAVEEGLGSISTKPGAEELDPETFRAELETALSSFAVIVLPRVLEGATRVYLQGWNGQSWSDGHGGIGTPDITVFYGTDRATIWDVKSSTRRKAFEALYGPEMSHYAAMYSDIDLTRVNNEDERLPGTLRLGYLTWVRLKSPVWQVISTEADLQHAAYAQIQREHTEAVVSHRVPDALGYNTGLCGTCEYAAPIEGALRPTRTLGDGQEPFRGCIIGIIQASVAVKAEAAAAEEANNG
jgi:hypothetical protein